MISNLNNRRFGIASDESTAGETNPRGVRVRGLFSEPPTLSLPAMSLSEDGSSAARTGTSPLLTSPNSASAQHETGSLIIRSPAGTGSVFGIVYNDLNHNGLQDTGESGIAGRTVYLDANNSGACDAGETAATTDASGMYMFSGLTAGTYAIAEIVPDWWRQTAPIAGAGYYQTDSDHGGAAYNWVDIATTGTATIITGDDAAQLIDLPFAFNFEGQTYTQIWAATNGMLTFNNNGCTNWTNTTLPTSTTPNALIAAYWDDLTILSGGHIRYFNDAANNRFIIEYQDVQVRSVSDSHLTFEVILDRNGTITYQYNSMSETGASATIGIENADGTAGSQFSYNTAGVVHNGFAIQYVSRNPTSQYVTVHDGELSGSLDFGTHDSTPETGGVSGHLWQDFNGDGVEQAGEPLMSGRQVFLDLNNNGTLDAGEPNQLTDSNGTYRFISVDAGAYTLRVSMPRGTWENWYETSPSASGASRRAIEGPQDSTSLPTAAGPVHIAPDFATAHVSGQLIVKLKPQLSAAAAGQVSALQALVGGQVASSTKNLGIQLWNVSDPSLEHAAQVLLASGLVEYAEPNYVLHASDLSSDVSSTSTTPNDPAFGQTWGLQNTGQTGGTLDDDIRARQAWDITTGSANVLVAVIDSGIDYNHPDLANNIWTNPGEIAGNGVDDDHNGYVDDVHGYDFVNSDGDPMDDNHHGTHCAGTIGADGNNGIGVAGVNWDVSMMALKFLDASGNGSTFNAIKAVEYATMMGARITSNSWGGGSYSQGLYDAIAASQAAGILFVVAAGNESNNNDSSPSYPSSYDLANVISVAATDSNDNLASFSNYGATSVDIAAPGVNIFSTTPSNTYSWLSGTSMAAPHVAGVAALLLAAYPNLTVQQLKSAILNGADPIAGLTGDVATGARLDAYRSLLLAGSNPAQSFAVNIPTGGVVVTHNVGIGGGSTPLADVIHGTTAAEVISASGGNDLVFGNNGNDLLFGDDGDDTLYGGAGYDYLVGGAGNDVLIGGDSGDTLMGGSGIDTVSYASSDIAVSVALDSGGLSGDATDDTYDSVENVIGTAYADVLIGTDECNVLDGGMGNDYLLGEDGNDVIFTGSGVDKVNAGDGDDTVQMLGYMTAADAINGSSGYDTVQLTGNYTGTGALVMTATTIANVERIALAAGYSYSLTTVDASLAAGRSLTVDGSALGIGNSLTFDGSAETNGTFTLTGGAGADTLIGSVGNDTLTGGASNDSLRPGLGNDSIYGGDGNDTVSFSGGRFNAADVIDGGAFSDMVWLNGDYSGENAVVFNATTIVNVETIGLGSGFNYSLTSDNATVASGQALTVDGSALGASNALLFNGTAETDGRFTLKGGAGADTLFGGAGNDYIVAGGGADSIRAGMGNDTVAAGDGNDTISFTNGKLNALDVLDGGAGTDTVSLCGDYAGTNAVSFNASTMVGVESIVMAAGFNYSLTSADSTVASGQMLTVDGSALGASNTLTFNGSAECNGTFSLIGGAGNDTLWGGTGNDTLTGGAGNDSLRAGTGNDAVNGGDGDDTASFSGGRFNAADSIDGGAGTDTVWLNGDYTGANAVTFGATTVTNVETIGLSGGFNYCLKTADATVAAGKSLTIDGSGLGAANTLSVDGSAETDGGFQLLGGAGTDTLIGGSGNDTLLGRAGNDSLRAGLGTDVVNGGDGDDAISFTGGRFDATDVIEGGAGTDSVWLNGDYAAANAVVFAAATIANVESIGLAAGFSYDLRSADATVASGKTLTIDGSGLGTTNSLTFNGAAETNGSFILISGCGADNFTGGLGADTFTYVAASRSTGLNYDTINNLDFANDSFDIPGAAGVVTGIDPVKTAGSLSTASFDADLTARMFYLGAHHAMLFTPNAGTLSGQTFLVIDCNGTAGYQAGQDLVIRLNGYSGTLTAGGFH